MPADPITGKTVAEIADLIGQLERVVAERERASIRYATANAKVEQLRTELLGLVRGSQHEVSVILNETVHAALPVDQSSTPELRSDQ